ncbi:MAG: glycosyltransferase family 2 protein [Pseudomonadota bacterium]|nr:glycosyltransferase family 2 protein [Pseudomonadota bacterium]
MLVPATPLSDPLVSVIISNYNYGRYLGEAIRSVLGQTYRKTEIIVVDDGSTDESHDVISGFKNQIRPLYRDHQGQCAALNAGFAASRGEVLVFFDADDYFIDDAIERLTKPFRGNKAISKSQGYMIAVDAKGNPLERKIPPLLSPSGNYKNVILKQGPWACAQAWTSGNAWARWFIKQAFPLPENVENKAFPDGCLNPLAALYGPIVTLTKPVAYYRIHGSNNGPVGTEFSIPSLSMRLTRMRYSHEFVAKRAASLGLDPPLDRWLKWRGSWRDNLMAYAISLMDPSRSAPRFHEVVLAPFASGRTGVLKAAALAVVLTVVWFSPRELALRMIQRLLRIPAPQKLRSSGAHEH